MQRFRIFLASYHPIVHSLIVGTVLARAAGSMSMPFMAIYLSIHMHMSPTLIGITIGVGSLAGTIGGFIGGTLSDRLGRKKVMMGALYTWGIVFICFSLASQVWIFILLSTLNGLCRSFFEPVSQALMGDLTEPERRLKVFSLRYTAINIGVAVGPLIGAYFGMAAGPLPFVITGCVYLLYALSLNYLLTKFGIRKIEGQKKEHVTFRSAWNVVVNDVSLRYYILGGILTAVGYSQMSVTLSQYVEKNFLNGIQLFALLMSANAIAVVLFQLPITRFTEKHTPLFSITIGNIMYALGDVGFALSHNWTAMIASMVIFTIGEVMCFPAGDVFIDRLAKEGMRGTYYGAKTFSSFGQFLGPWIGGFLLASYGGPTLFLTVAAISLSSTAAYWNGQRTYQIRTGKIMHMTRRA